jgi:PhnB protein
MATKRIPDGYHTATPYLIVSGAAKAIDFYRQAFGAREVMRFEGPGGKVMHAELQIGDSRIMLADECPEMNARSPLALGGTHTSILLYVDDVDSFAKRAKAAGAKEIRPVKDQFYGDRSGTFSDPFGHMWTISTHVEDVADDELRRRAEEAMGQKAGA